MKMTKAVALCALLVVCAATFSVAQGPAAPAPKGPAPKAPAAPGPGAEVVYEDETPRGPPLNRGGPTGGPAATQAPAPGGAPAGGVAPGPGGAPGASDPGPAPEEPVCECPLPKDGGGFYGRGKSMVETYNCKCENACEFVPTPSGGIKPSCATLCKCPHDVKVQTFTIKRGPVVSSYPIGSGAGLLFGRRRLQSSAAEGNWYITY